MPLHHTDIHVRTDDDLFRLWQSLMGPGGFGCRSVWLFFLDADGHSSGVIVPIDDVPAEPDEPFLHGLSRISKDAGDTTADSVPILLSRPGRRGMTASDRLWAAALREAVPACRRWPVHLATRDHIQVFAPDDLLAVS